MEALGREDRVRTRKTRSVSEMDGYHYGLILTAIMVDMRKPLSRDVGRRSVRANGREITVSSDDVS